MAELPEFRTRDCIASPQPRSIRWRQLPHTNVFCLGKLQDSTIKQSAAVSMHVSHARLGRSAAEGLKQGVHTLELR